MNVNCLNFLMISHWQLAQPWQYSQLNIGDLQSIPLGHPVWNAQMELHS